MPETREVFSKYITLRNGKRLYARHYGLEAFKFEVNDKTEEPQKKDEESPKKDDQN